MKFSNKLPTHLADVAPLILERLSAGQCVRYYPRGTSMLPMLRQGIDSVELSPVPTALKKYDLPFYTRANGQYVLHRIVRTGDAYTCVGDNQFELEFPVAHNQIFAVVTAFYRGNKRIEVTDKRYRAYCVLWHYTRPLRHLYRKIRSFAAKCWRKLRKREPPHVS